MRHLPPVLDEVVYKIVATIQTQSWITKVQPMTRKHGTTFLGTTHNGMQQRAEQCTGVRGE